MDDEYKVIETSNRVSQRHPSTLKPKNDEIQEKVLIVADTKSETQQLDAGNSTYTPRPSSDLVDLLKDDAVLDGNFHDSLEVVLDSLINDHSIIAVLASLSDDEFSDEKAQELLLNIDLCGYSSLEISRWAEYLLQKEELSVQYLRNLLNISMELNRNSVWMNDDRFSSIDTYSQLCLYLGVSKEDLEVTIARLSNKGVTSYDSNTLFTILRSMKIYLSTKETNEFIVRLQDVTWAAGHTDFNKVPLFIQLQDFFLKYRSMASQYMLTDVVHDISEAEGITLMKTIQNHLENYTLSEIAEVIYEMFKHEQQAESSINPKKEMFDIITLIKNLVLRSRSAVLNSYEDVCDIIDDTLDLDEALEETGGTFDDTFKLLHFSRLIENLRFDSVNECPCTFWNTTIRSFIANYSQELLFRFILEIGTFLHEFGQYLTRDHIETQLKDLLQWEFTPVLKSKFNPEGTDEISEDERQMTALANAAYQYTSIEGKGAADLVDLVRGMFAKRIGDLKTWHEPCIDAFEDKIDLFDEAMIACNDDLEMSLKYMKLKRDFTNDNELINLPLHEGRKLGQFMVEKLSELQCLQKLEIDPIEALNEALQRAQIEHNDTWKLHVGDYAWEIAKEFGFYENDDIYEKFSTELYSLHKAV